MANIRLIGRRIRVARNISQITRAMEMVEASKMKKAQDKAVMGKPYAEKIYETTRELAGKTKTNTEDLALLKLNNSQRSLVILVSTTKGFCGGLNTNLFRQLNLWFTDKGDTDFVTFGKKGESFILRTGRKLLADFSGSPYLENIGALTNLIVSAFSKGEYGHVWIVYNNFVSLLKQIPTHDLILPIGEISEEKDSGISEFVIEPSPRRLLEELLPHYLEIQLRKAVLEAEASEHSARMIAMKNATDNAQQLMSDLTMEYNKIRQQLITYEIADIVTAREAMA